MKKYIEVEIAVTFVVFWLLVIITSIPQYSGITGHAILARTEDGQSSIQELFRNNIFNTVGSGAKICINVKNSDEDIFSYKIRKRGNIFNVEPSILYCDGINNEDFVFTFENYDALLNAKNNFNIKQFKNPAPNNDFKIWESTYIGVGGLVRCDDDFRTKYCPFLNNHLTLKEQKALGITCCDDPDKEEPKAMSLITTFIKQFWWLIGLIIISVSLGLGAIILLGQKEEEELSPDYELQLKEYIEEARRYNFGDNEIKERLLESGWDEKHITKAFNKLRKEHLFSLKDRFEKININTFKDKDNTINVGEIQ
jgi:hypothetical protein